MVYGFIAEELNQINERDPLYLQAQYAKYIKRYCELNMENKIIVDEQNKVFSVKNINVMLRCTCDNVSEAITSFNELGAVLIEDKEDIIKVEKWYKHDICNRRIIEVTYGRLLDEDREIVELLNKYNMIFIKSKDKGFSCVVPSKIVLNKDKKFMDFLKQQCNLWGEELLMTQYIDIQQDSLGRRESRHVVMYGKIINSSRQIKSLMHRVPKSHLIAAKKKVETINLIKNFPKNYVLDLGEYKKGDSTEIDVIEINPITTALCFVNNSIYEDNTNNADFGAEYYYDYLKNSKYYSLRKTSNGKYNYISDSFYDFS